MEALAPGWNDTKEERVELEAWTPESPVGLHDILVGLFWRGAAAFRKNQDCLNNGKKHTSGLCECPPHFGGERCETMICRNNGTLMRDDGSSREYCKCPSQEFISGAHCEVVKCQNGGRSLNDGTCQCIDTWYSGQFCEFYSRSWLAVLGIPILCLVIIMICCIVCRVDLFPPKPRRRNRRSESVRNLPTGEGRPRQTRVTLGHVEVAEPACTRDPPPPVYLSTYLSETDFKPIEPPPPYEQAITQCVALSPAAYQVPQVSSPDLNNDVRLNNVQKHVNN